MSKKELVGTLMERMQKFGYFPSFTNVKIFIREYEKMTKPEPQKPVIPQFVADWIEKCKSERRRLHEALIYTPFGVNSWVSKPKNQNIFARAWLDGYEVKEEAKYTVKVRGICANHETLNCGKRSKKWLFSDQEENTLYNTKFTRKELEDANFGWVFNCEGVEIEEVQE